MACFSLKSVGFNFIFLVQMNGNFRTESGGGSELGSDLQDLKIQSDGDRAPTFFLQQYVAVYRMWKYIGVGNKLKYSKFKFDACT